MASSKRPEGSMEKVFNRILFGSLLLHIAMFFLVMSVEPPPPPSQEEYAVWLKKVTPPKVIEEKKPEPVKEPELAKPEEAKPEEKPEVVEKAPTKAAPAKGKPSAKAGDVGRRAEVREKLSGAGLLATIGAATEEGSLANVFESGAVVGKDLNAVLSERGGVRVSGGTRIGKKGDIGPGTSADIGDVEVGAGSAAGVVGGRKGVVPQAFVKSTEAVLPKGGIDERGVRMALKRRERGIQQCYERQLKTNAKLRGKVVLEWTIDEQGRVVAIKVLQNTLGDEKVSDCMMDIIKRIRFPQATKGVVPVRKTFVFESG